MKQTQRKKAKVEKKQEEVNEEGEGEEVNEEGEGEGEEVNEEDEEDNSGDLYDSRKKYTTVPAPSENNISVHRQYQKIESGDAVLGKRKRQNK